MSGTLIDFPEESNSVTPIRFDTWRKEQEIDGAAILTSHSAEPVLISKQAATVAIRSLSETVGESIRDKIWWENSFAINALRYGSALILSGTSVWIESSLNSIGVCWYTPKVVKVEPLLLAPRVEILLLLIIVLVLVIVVVVWSWEGKNRCQCHVTLK